MIRFAPIGTVLVLANCGTALAHHCDHLLPDYDAYIECETGGRQGDSPGRSPDDFYEGETNEYRIEPYTNYYLDVDPNGLLGGDQNPATTNDVLEFKIEQTPGLDDLKMFNTDQHQLEFQ